MSPAGREPRDARERALIETELDRNMMVLAGAGAGKTHELIGRMIALLRSGKVGVGQIAAITFTRKAAGELRERFVARLRETLDQTEGSERQTIQLALQHVDQCFMGTIHSFCGRLLRERPLEARVPPDFVELDDEQEKRLSRVAWDEYFRNLYAASDPRLSQLEDAGIGPDDLWDFYRRRSATPELPLRMEEVPVPDLPGAAQAVVSFAREARQHVPPVLEKGKDEMMRLFDFIEAAAEHRGIDAMMDAAALLERLPTSSKVTLNRWGPNQAYARSLRDEIYPAFHHDVVEPVLRAWREHLYAPAARIVDEAVEYYALRRREEGRLTYADLLLFAAGMLRDFTDVRSFFQRRFRVILVDEFQDTDPVQAEILLYLSGSDQSQKDWRRINPRPGSLFLVGDEKQAIYRFRRADVATFRFMRDRIEATGGRIVHLNTSFRTLGNLCGWFNESFLPVFARHEPDYQAEYGELYDYRAAGADAQCVRKISLAQIAHNKAQDIVAAEARRVAGFIRAAIDGRSFHNGTGPDALLGERARPNDFLILTRTRTNLSQYAGALEAAGIPYDITGGRDLSSAEEVRALVELLQVVREPDNSVHFVSLLRGLFFGASDAELYAYRRAGGRFHVGVEPPAVLADPLRGKFIAAQALIDRAANLLRTRTPAAAVECLLDTLGLPAVAASRPLGSSRAGNLLRLLSLVKELEARGYTWGEVVSELQAVIEGNAYELEEMALDYGGADAVRIMNIHQAKGLQAKVVFLADPFNSHDGKHEPDCHVARVGEDPHLSILIQRRYGDFQKSTLAQPVGWEADAEAEKRYEAGEATRLIYVAATRAENLLVVSTYPGGTEDGHRYRELYEALANVPELEAAGETDVPSVGQRLPDLDELNRRRLQQFEYVRSPTYRRGTVTGYEEEASLSVPIATGRGRDYGSLIHAVLEDAVRGSLPDELSTYLHSRCDAFGFPSTDATGVRKVLDAFRSSALWAEIRDAHEVYTEVPLALRVDDTVIRGKIDLIYRTEDGWKIVDYKTDVDASSGQMPLNFAHYIQQVRAYAAHWESVTNEPVLRAGLYGTVGAGGYVEAL